MDPRQESPGFVRWRAPGSRRQLWACLGVVLAVGLASCGKSATTSVLVTLLAQDATARPQFATIAWTTPDGVTHAAERFPATGDIGGTGLNLGSFSIELDDALPGIRKVLVRGMRGNTPVSVGAARIPWLPRQAQKITVELSTSLADRDGDGIPDVIDDDCPGGLTATDTACPGSKDGGANGTADGGATGFADGADGADGVGLGTETDGRQAPSSDGAAPLMDTRGGDSSPGGNPGSLPDAGLRIVDAASADRAATSAGKGLLLYWAFDDETGPTALDRSGNGYNGTYTGITDTPMASTTVAPLQFGNPQSRMFLRANRHAVRFPAMPAALKVSTLTLAAWFRSTSSDTSGAMIVSAGDNYSLYLRTTEVATAYRKSGGFVSCTSPAAGQLDGTWHHLAATYDAVGMVLYLDGVQKAKCAGKPSIVYERGTDFWVGRHGYGDDTWNFDGNIDDVRVYNRALTATEIQSLSMGNP